jgi:hypothetical protein
MSKRKDQKNPTEASPPASPLSRRDFLKIAGVAAGTAAISGGLTRDILAAPPRNVITTPTISCGDATEVSIEIAVCAPAGGTGLPAGFSLQWMTCDEYAQHDVTNADGSTSTVYNTWYASDDPRLCKASFSGNANLSRYNLSAGQCVTVEVGEFLFDEGASTNCDDTLLCGTCYVFRAFGHATNSLTRSEFTANKECSTLDCNLECDPINCTLTQGYWKTHGPEGCVEGNNSNEWPVNNLTLGAYVYTDIQLCSILNTAAQGNGLIALAHQLIAAKLNIAKDADGTDAALCITQADALIGNLKVPPVGAWTCSKGQCSGDYLAPTDTALLTECLADYNEGATGPGHCC